MLILKDSLQWLSLLVFLSLPRMARGFAPTIEITSSRGSHFKTFSSLAFAAGAPHPVRRPAASTSLLLSFNNNSNNNNISPGGGINMNPSFKLLLCILIDLIGVSSYAVPGLGEATDIAWAPISALLVNYLFGNGVFTGLALVEELLPGFDIIPTATIAWFVENGKRVDTTQPPPSSFNDSPPSPSQPQSTNAKRPDERKASVKRPNTSDAIDAEVVDD